MTLGSPTDEFLRLIPRSFARRHLVLSTGRHGNIEDLAVSSSTAPWAAHNVGARLGLGVESRVASAEEIAAAIDAAYASAPTESRVPEPAEVGDPVRAHDRDLLALAGKGPIVQLVDSILFEALQQRASDVHLQPLADHAIVRYRLDGTLRDAAKVPHETAVAVASRLKVMGRLDVAERRVAQDGRATVTIGQGGLARRIDLRLATLPTSYGERVVVRILDTSRAAHLLDPTSLGMPDSLRDAFLARAGRAHGLILATGPTGSGKTTTLYATLHWLATRSGAGVDARAHNILTIEDPIEYELSTVGLAISQTQVNARKGITFGTGLRHILRQDPDLIMVGEVRDQETARLAIQAALTGHLVLTTLHTNDAVGAVTRLVDLGAERYLVAASISCVLAQRLIRLLHTPCAGAGCSSCGASGFRGRRGVFEILVPDHDMRDHISQGASGSRLRADAARLGTVGLLHAARDLVALGLTTEAEVRRSIEGIES